DGRAVPITGPHAKSLWLDGSPLELSAVALAREGLQSLEHVPLGSGEREALESLGIGWLLPIGHDPVRAVLLLGNRLAGTWLGLREIQDLERFAHHLEVSLENAALRRE